MICSGLEIIKVIIVEQLGIFIAPGLMVEIVNWTDESPPKSTVISAIKYQTNEEHRPCAESKTRSGLEAFGFAFGV